MFSHITEGEVLINCVSQSCLEIFVTCYRLSLNKNSSYLSINELKRFKTFKKIYELHSCPTKSWKVYLQFNGKIKIKSKLYIKRKLLS